MHAGEIHYDSNGCFGHALDIAFRLLDAPPAKRAVLALRDAAAPLPEQLASLAGQFRTADDPAVHLEVSGEARPIPAEASVAVYRTAQER
jgi:FAD/FMN-containing dehydrogenase